MALLHISRAHFSETDKEEKQLAELDKYQRKFLSQRICSLCENQLHRTGCGAIYKEFVCSQEERMALRAKCLKTYKPRLERRKGNQR